MLGCELSVLAGAVGFGVGPVGEGEAVGVEGGVGGGGVGGEG